MKEDNNDVDDLQSLNHSGLVGQFSLFKFVYYLLLLISLIFILTWWTPRVKKCQHGKMKNVKANWIQDNTESHFDS